MDQATFAHMMCWIDNQFVGKYDDDTLAHMATTMIERYESDEEHYGNAGWWRVYEDCLDAIEHLDGSPSREWRVVEL